MFTPWSFWLFLWPYRIWAFINHFLLLFPPCPTFSGRNSGRAALIRRWKTSSSSPPSWTSVSVVLAAAPTLTPPDGEPAGSAEVLPTEMARITPLEWSPTLVFCTVPVFLLLNLSLFTISIVTSPVLGLVTHLKRKLLSSKETHDNKPLSPFLIYSNGPYGISTVTSISGTVLIFNIVVRELHTHADIFQMRADFHFLETFFFPDTPELTLQTN